MARVSDAHSEIGPELRQLAQTILDRVEPALRAAAAMTGGRGDSPGACQQVWCPVCALAAIVSGEQHPLLDTVAEHSVALLTLVRGLLDNGADNPPDNPEATRSGPKHAAPDNNADSNGHRPSPPPPGHYQGIPIKVEE